MRIILTAIVFIITFYGTTALMNKWEDKINNPVVVDRELAKWEYRGEIIVEHDTLQNYYYWIASHWYKNP